MSPRRFAVFILAILIPAVLWGATLAGKDDLVYRTRSFMAQAKKDRPGKLHAFVQLCSLPNHEPGESTDMFERLWLAFRICIPDKTAYGSQAPTHLEGREHEHRQVVIDGHTASGQRIHLNVEWVRYMGNWYIQDFSGSGEDLRQSEPDNNPYGVPPDTRLVN